MKARHSPPPCSNGPYRTSISGPPKIFNRAKELAAQQRLTFSALVVNVLEKYLAKHDRKPEATP